jgi:hypothetical protein
MLVMWLFALPASAQQSHAGTEIATFRYVDSYLPQCRAMSWYLHEYVSLDGTTRLLTGSHMRRPPHTGTHRIQFRRAPPRTQRFSAFACSGEPEIERVTHGELIAIDP